MWVIVFEQSVPELDDPAASPGTSLILKERLDLLETRFFSPVAFSLAC